MKAICVDDEAILLRVLTNAVEQSPDIELTASFSTGKAAIEYAKKNPVDIAFLDIEIRRMTGIELAVELRKIHPKLLVVFCTGYEQYALEAFKIHANGYLTKPIHYCDVQEQIDNIKSLTGYEETKQLSVQCFGDFEVFYEEKPISFKRSKTKELFAYLISRRGATVSTGQIVAALWEDESDEKKLKSYFYQVQHDLKHCFSEIGFDDIVIRNSNGYAVNTKYLDCDYYKYLEGDIKTQNIQLGEFMYQYSWAEDIAAELFFNQ